MKIRQRYIPLLSATVLLTTSVLPAMADAQGEWIPVGQKILDKSFFADEKYGSWRLVDNEVDSQFIQNDEWRLIDDQTNITFVKDGEWVLKGTESLRSFNPDALIPVDPVGAWKMVDFKIDKVWIADAAAIKKNVSHSQTVRRLEGDAVQNDEVLKSSVKTLGTPVTTYGRLSDDPDEETVEIEIRTSPNGAYSYQVEKYRINQLRTKTVTTPYRITDTYAQRVKHTYTFGIDYDDLNRITCFDPIAGLTITSEVKDTSHENQVVVTDFAENGKLRLAYKDGNDVTGCDELLDGNIYERQVLGSLASNAGMGKVGFNTTSKAFASNTQIGKAAGKVSYAGSRERAKSGVDTLKVSELKDSQAGSANSLIASLDKLGISAKNASSGDLASLAAQIAALKATANNGTLRSDLVAKVNAAYKLASEQVAATKAAIAAKAAAALATRYAADLVVKRAAEEAAKVSAAAAAKLAVDMAAADAAAKAAAAKLAAEKAAADLAARQAAAKAVADAAAKLAAMDSIDKLFFDPAYNAKNVSATIKGYAGWLNDDVDCYRDVTLALASATNDDERKYMIAAAQAKLSGGKKFFSDSEIESLARVGEALKNSANKNSILNLMTSNGKTLDRGNKAWINTPLKKRVKAMNDLIDHGKFSQSDLSAIKILKAMFPKDHQLKDLKV